MSTTAMPSLTSNRLVIRTAGRVGAPAPEIGNLLYVASDVDSEGFSVEPEHGPMVTWRRVTLTVIIAWVAFGFCWFGGMIATNSATGGAIVGALAGGFFAWLSWRGMGKTKRIGACVYVGTEGVTTVNVDGGPYITKTMMYGDDVLTTTDHTAVSINGVYAYTIEVIRFFEAGGGFAGAVVGTYNGQPGPLAFAVRATIAAAGAKRAESARARLAAGQQIVFPLLADGCKPNSGRGEALVLDATSLAYFKSPTAQPLRIERATAKLSLRQGYLDLSAGGAGVVLGTFERSTVGNYDLLAELVDTTR